MRPTQAGPHTRHRREKSGPDAQLQPANVPTTQRRVRRGAFKSVHALEKAITEYLAEHNKFTNPSSWVFDADAMHDRIKRVIQVTSDSGYEYETSRFARVVRELGMTAGRKEGIVVHSLRHFFETTAVNAGIPQLVINAWLGHKSDQSMAAVYYHHHQDDESQKFMKQVPFGTGGPAANAGGRVVDNDVFTGRVPVRPSNYNYRSVRRCLQGQNRDK